VAPLIRYRLTNFTMNVTRPMASTSQNATRLIAIPLRIPPDWNVRRIRDGSRKRQAIARATTAHIEVEQPAHGYWHVPPCQEYSLMTSLMAFRKTAGCRLRFTVRKQRARAAGFSIAPGRFPFSLSMKIPEMGPRSRAKATLGRVTLRLAFSTVRKNQERPSEIT